MQKKALTGKTVQGSMLALYFGMFYELEGDISMSYRTKIYLKRTFLKKSENFQN